MTATMLGDVNYGKTGLLENRRQEDSLWEKLCREEIRGGDDKFLKRQIDRKGVGFGGEQTKRSCVEVQNGMWQMRTKVH